ncbi:MAG: 16S rRNA (guanine(527)-N(7))-methyltransferase RsmG [Myxococcales bacterium]|nr:16S rRNA (guanine(527)-N(7))-methyltransferase RsmG [Myxococcales bacterium]
MTGEHAREPLTFPETTPLAVPAGFAAALSSSGVALDESHTIKIAEFLAMLLAMNERMNLTAITSADDAWTRHALDALSLAPELASLPKGASVLDVGSGGGVPAIPLAIVRGDLRFTLVEATKKKAWFLEEAARRLGLANVTVRAERAESLAKPPLARSFDAVTARAVAKIAELVPWTAPFAKTNAKLLFIKGARADEELAEAKRVIANAKLVHERTTPTSTGRIVVFSVAR